jgi:hypothetical protein
MCAACNGKCAVRKVMCAAYNGKCAACNGDGTSTNNVDEAYNDVGACCNGFGITWWNIFDFVVKITLKLFCDIFFPAFCKKNHISISVERTVFQTE